jgi:sugar/nucleoside kinase (ribokinase family)
VGAASRDLATDDPRGWRLGGAVAYTSLTLARLGLPVRALVGVDEPASRADELDLLRDAGADVGLVHLARGPVFENVETASGRTQRCVVPSDSIAPAALLERWIAADDVAAVVFGPVAGELDAAWASVAREHVPVALGWQGLLRELRAGELVRRAPPVEHALVRRADLVVASAGDFAPDVELAELLSLVGARATLVVTAASRGGLVSRPGPGGTRAWRRYPAVSSGREVDATGAGDVFLAAMLAGLLDRSSGRNFADSLADAALRVAAAAASLVVEGPGLLGVPEAAAIAERLRSVGPERGTSATTPPGRSA